MLSSSGDINTNFVGFSFFVNFDLTNASLVATKFLYLKIFESHARLCMIYTRDISFYSISAFLNMLEFQKQFSWIYEFSTHMIESRIDMHYITSTQYHIPRVINFAFYLLKCVCLDNKNWSCCHTLTFDILLLMVTRGYTNHFRIDSVVSIVWKFVVFLKLNKRRKWIGYWNLQFEILKQGKQLKLSEVTYKLTLF